MFTLQIFVSVVSKILLKDSIVPFSCGWYGVLFWWWTSNSCIKDSIVLLMKCVPWSFIKVFRHPNLVMISSKMNCTVVVALQSLTSLASSHPVKYYVVVMMYLAHVCLPSGLIGPTTSMAHFSNTCSVNCGSKGISSRLDIFPTLWHTSQDL